MLFTVLDLHLLMCAIKHVHIITEERVCFKHMLRTHCKEKLIERYIDNENNEEN